MIATERLHYAAGRSFAADAEPVAQLLMKYALPANFIEDLKNHVGIFEKVTTDYAAALRQCEAGRTAIDKLMDQANDATVHLDALVRNSFRNDPTELSVWDAATKYGRSKRKKDGKEEPSSEQAPSPPDAAAAAA